MIDFLASMNEWYWLVFGVVLVVAEIIAPGTFLLWPGLAAIIVGVLKAMMPALAWTVCVSVWAVLSVALVAGFVVYRKSHPDSAPVSLLNRRGEQYVGRRFTLEKPVVNGRGEIRVDDSIWKAVSNQELSPGTPVIVTAVEGTALRIITAENA